MTSPTMMTIDTLVKIRPARFRPATLVQSAVMVLYLTCGCVSGGGDDTSRSDAGTGGTDAGGAGGANSEAGLGGTAGSAGSAGSAGDADVAADSGPNLALPVGCAPADMRFDCNPMTNQGCDDSEVCDYGLSEYFVCFAGPNSAAEGEACDLEKGPFCKAGWTCDTPGPDETAGVCHRHCCSSDDCDAPQTCAAFDPEFGSLGVCH